MTLHDTWVTRRAALAARAALPSDSPPCLPCLLLALAYYSSTTFSTPGVYFLGTVTSMHDRPYTVLRTIASR